MTGESGVMGRGEGREVVSERGRDRGGGPTRTENRRLFMRSPHRCETGRTQGPDGRPGRVSRSEREPGTSP